MDWAYLGDEYHGGHWGLSCSGGAGLALHRPGAYSGIPSSDDGRTGGDGGSIPMSQLDILTLNNARRHTDDLRNTCTADALEMGIAAGLEWGLLKAAGGKIADVTNAFDDFVRVLMSGRDARAVAGSVKSSPAAIAAAPTLVAMQLRTSGTSWSPTATALKTVVSTEVFLASTIWEFGEAMVSCASWASSEFFKLPSLMRKHSR